MLYVYVDQFGTSPEKIEEISKLVPEGSKYCGHHHFSHRHSCTLLEATTELLKFHEKEIGIESDSVIFITTREEVVLRVLRHIREEFDGLKLNHKTVVFWGNDKSGNWNQYLPNEEGDVSRWYDGLFDWRMAELF